MNPLLILLLQQMAGNQNTQQNPLMALLGGNQQQDPTQQLIAALSGATGQQANAINPQLLQLLVGNQQPQLQGGDIQQLMQLLGGQQSPQNNSDLSQLLQLLQGQKQEKTLEEQLSELLSKGGLDKKDSNEDVLERLQNQFNQEHEQKNSEAELTDAITFVTRFDKFIEDHNDMLPAWFDVNEVKEDVDKWAKTAIERAQGLAAATSKAFFKNESMLELLEEKDRLAVKDHVLKDGIKSHEIDRGVVWPIINRAVFNKSKLSEVEDSATQFSKGEEAIANYEARFKTGQQPPQQQVTA